MLFSFSSGIRRPVGFNVPEGPTTTSTQTSTITSSSNPNLNPYVSNFYLVPTFDDFQLIQNPQLIYDAISSKDKIQTSNLKLAYDKVAPKTDKPK